MREYLELASELEADLRLGWSVNFNANFLIFIRVSPKETYFSRCWDYLSLLHKTGNLTLLLILNLLLVFFLLMLHSFFIKLLSDLGLLEKLWKQICKTVDSGLAASLESLTNQPSVASLISLF